MSKDENCVVNDEELGRIVRNQSEGLPDRFAPPSWEELSEPDRKLSIEVEAEVVRDGK